MARKKNAVSSVADTVKTVAGVVAAVGKVASAVAGAAGAVSSVAGAVEDAGTAVNRAVVKPVKRALGVTKAPKKRPAIKGPRKPVKKRVAKKK